MLLKSRVFSVVYDIMQRYSQSDESCIDLLKLCRDERIKVVKNSLVDVLCPDVSGMLFTYGDEYVIVYDDTLTSEQCRRTVAHELGHYFLNHYEILNEPCYYEREADLFATLLLGKF